MRARSAAVAFLLALAAGAGLVLWLLSPGTAPAPESRPEPARPSRPLPDPAPREAASPPAVPHTGNPASGTEAPGAATAGPTAASLLEGIPDKVRAAASALQIPPAALRAAWDAFQAGGSGHVPPRFLEALKGHGADGFRAVIALLRGDLNGSWFPELAGACWAPGLEPLLIETSEDSSRHIWSRWSALDSLGCADTPATRDYLVARLGRETDSGLFWSASRSLGALKEPRGAAAAAARIEEVAWGEAIRTSLMADVAAMDKTLARDLLVQRLTTPGVDLVEPTFRVLAGVDREAAKREAEALLDGPRGSSLGPTLVWTLREILGRPQKDGDPR